ncbi:type II toxin-antitoxin system VapC family toxin [Lentzea sp.]|uniref:type II toxin-antitoxin system VapC family toxin n=1 Tax=Lentzea sp. TaxID=56099 RepID=UPI002B9D409B|nr:type II toxin-antitoxin system VapC family toxin [Lentzea sp.]HUQ61362.1 type II toxin-antitoxin system VapC family toxin [Lentzea sp.]
MSLVVVDASVLAVFYSADDHRRQQTVDRMAAGHALFAPAHLDVEVVSALRTMARRSAALAASVPSALRHLAGLPVRRMPLAPLLSRMWDLRDDITPYDAAYVALAEQLRATLITCDVRLASAPGAKCTFDVIS